MQGTSGHLEIRRLGNPHDLPHQPRPAPSRAARGPAPSRSDTRSAAPTAARQPGGRFSPDRSAVDAARAYYENAGPALLSIQDPDVEAPTGPPPGWWTVLYEHLQGEQDQDRAWRYSWWLHWRELARLILPWRYHWVVTPNTMNRGNPVNQDIIDSTGTQAMDVMAGGMSAGLASASRPWFGLDPVLGPSSGPEPSSAVRRWLDDAVDRINAVLIGSNFYDRCGNLFRDLSTFNTSPMLIYEHPETIINCYVPCAGEYYLRVGGDLLHNALGREFNYTVTQIVDFFGLANCPADIQQKWREGGAALSTEYVVSHRIEPNFKLTDRQRGDAPLSVLPGRFVYREVYWLRNVMTPQPLALRGFMERPFMAMTWSQTSNDPYGRGPSMEALGAIAQLQQEQMRKAEYIDHFVRPPMTAPPELRNQPSSTRPGDITYTTLDTAFKPAFMANPAGMMPIVEDIKEVQQRIRVTFKNNFFMAITQMEGIQPRERMELALRQSEQIQQVGPVIESAEREFSHAIYRVASIMHRRGMFAPMPAELQGMPLRIVYASQMKLLQRASETAAIQATAQFAGQMTEGALAAGLRPPVRVLNLDGAVRRFADAVGAPAVLIFSEREVAQHDEAREKAQQQQQALAATLPAVQAAQGLSKIPVTGSQSAIGAMLGTDAPPS